MFMRFQPCLKGTSSPPQWNGGQHSIDTPGDGSQDYRRDSGSAPRAKQSSSRSVIRIYVPLSPSRVKPVCVWLNQGFDIVFTGLDINPFTNQNVRNRIVQFYYKSTGLDPFRVIYFQILNNDGSIFQTNDPSSTYPTAVSGTIFGSMVIGTSRGVQSFQTADARNRGGGLAPQWQAIPQAINFWDLGSLDGKLVCLGRILCD
jgi:hypothetical protein